MEIHGTVFGILKNDLQDIEIRSPRTFVLWAGCGCTDAVTGLQVRCMIGLRDLVGFDLAALIISAFISTLEIFSNTKRSSVPCGRKINLIVPRDWFLQYGTRLETMTPRKLLCRSQAKDLHGLRMEGSTNRVLYRILPRPLTTRAQGDKLNQNTANLHVKG